jgi:SAM-dependent methyltransferase
MHLEEWDRWRYVSEMYRVLRPGGRAYYDNFNLLGDQGWDFFLAMSRLDPINRPANISKSSTPQELERYALQAGFEILRIVPNRLWVQLAALKPPLR